MVSSGEHRTQKSKGQTAVTGRPIDFWRVHGWRHPFLFLHAIYYFGNPRRYIRKLLAIFNALETYLPKPLWRVPGIKSLLVYLPARYHGKVLTVQDARKLINLDAEVHVAPEQAKRVLPYDLVNQIVINSAGTIALGDCVCRSLIENPCKPNHVCMFIGEPFATYAVKRGKELNIHYATKEQALDALQQAHEAGYIHNAFFKDAAGDRLFALCNCCSCCCKGIGITNIFKELYRGDDPMPRMLESSGYLAVRDEERCTGCGVCVDVCHFQAMKRNGSDKPSVDPYKCLGCGHCVDRCEQKALTLQRNPQGSLPLDVNELQKDAVF